jgi:hypothetical protein
MLLIVAVAMTLTEVICIISFDFGFATSELQA